MKIRAPINTWKGNYWVPQPGPQADAAVCPADELFFGGSRGGGKSDTLIGRQVRGAQKWGHYWNGLLVRRKYKEFAEIRRRYDELIRNGLPAERIGGESQINYIRYKGGAVTTLAATLRLEMADGFQSQQYTEIGIDEGPTIPFIAPLIDRLKGCLRSPHGVPCRIVTTGNPGGAGASQIKTMYIDPVDEGAVNRIVQTLPDGSTYQFSRVFIRSGLKDNKILVENDPAYVARLLSIRDELLRAAWLDGRWDVFIGQAFTITERHVITPIWPIPQFAPIYMTFDWGFGKPFSVGWWWVDGSNRVYRFAEWYGWDKVTPDVGLRITDPEIAEGIKAREAKMKIDGREITRLAGHDSFNKKPNYMGGGQGPSTATEFSKYGLRIRPADPNRELKIRQFRNRLRVPASELELPMLVVYDTCREFLRTVPTLCADELTGEYIEDGQEDHIFDESCQICMARPIGETDEQRAERIEKDLRKQHGDSDNIARIASNEYNEVVEGLKDRWEALR